MKKSFFGVIILSLMLTGIALATTGNKPSVQDVPTSELLDGATVVSGVVYDSSEYITVEPTYPTIEEIYQLEEQADKSDDFIFVDGAAAGVHFITADFNVDALALDPLIKQNNLWDSAFFRDVNRNSLMSAVLSPIMPKDDWEIHGSRQISGTYHVLNATYTSLVGLPDASSQALDGFNMFCFVVQVYNNSDLDGYTHIDGNKIYFSDIAEHIILQTDKHTVYNFTELVHGKPIDELLFSYGMPEENLDYALENYQAIIKTIASIKYL